MTVEIRWLTRTRTTMMVPANLEDHWGAKAAPVAETYQVLQYRNIPQGVQLEEGFEPKWIDVPTVKEVASDD